MYVTCGAGLTEVASAWLIEPRIAERLTVIWIGGHEHDGLAELPPGGTDMEYNLHIDPVAGQVVFNDSDLRIWQVPRNMYRTVIASRAELLVRMRPHGDLGRYLFDALAEVVQKVVALGMHLGETYVLGDSPLVLLTALVTAFEPGTASSFYVTRPCPRIADTGLYVPTCCRLDSSPAPRWCWVTSTVRPKPKPLPIGHPPRSRGSSLHRRAGCAAMRRLPTPWPCSSTCCPMIRSVGTQHVGWWNWSGATAITSAAALWARR